MRYLLLIVICLNSTLCFSQLPKSAVIKSRNGRPTIFVNNQPQTPAFYSLTHAYGGGWSWEEVPARNINNF